MSYSVKFGPIDYWKMSKRYGIGILFRYFFDAHLFDIIHGTDTHVWVPKQMQVNLGCNSSHGTSYQASWTSEIEWAFTKVHESLGEDFANYSFVDVGCGKGKATLVWKRRLASLRIKQKVFGIDYDKHLIEIAKSNHEKMFDDKEDIFSCDDAVEFDYSSIGDSLVLYFYNPFDRQLLKTFFEKIKTKKLLVVYNNPVHVDVLLDLGFEKLHEKSESLHPNCNTVIVERNK